MGAKTFVAAETGKVMVKIAEAVTSRVAEEKKKRVAEKTAFAPELEEKILQQTRDEFGSELREAENADIMAALKAAE